MTDNRIAQFKQMAEADPENELGHMSLGKAYLDDGQPSSAAESLRRAIELNPKLSKAYQLLGQALDAAGDRDGAIATMTSGLDVAKDQGDRMPMEGMIASLKGWGVDVADAPKPSAPSASEGGEGAPCSRCRRPGNRMDKQPLKGELGEKIHQHVCRACWTEWIGMGTKVINELGLALSTKAGQDAYEQYLIEFLMLEEV